MSNCDTRTVSINGTPSGCTPGSSCQAGFNIGRAADGYWYMNFTAGTSTICTASWWWN
jgi:hypothetical protein